MHIVCDKCGAEYEYELPDAPAGVTGRNLRFRCSACGHRFLAVKSVDLSVDLPVGRRAAARPRLDPSLSGSVDEVPPSHVQPSTGPAALPPGAMLLKQDGVVYQLNDQATLQRWIVERRVLREDLVSSGDGQWEIVGLRTDLEPFFHLVERAGWTEGEPPSRMGSAWPLQPPRDLPVHRPEEDEEATESMSPAAPTLPLSPSPSRLEDELPTDDPTADSPTTWDPPAQRASPTLVPDLDDLQFPAPPSLSSQPTSPRRLNVPGSSASPPSLNLSARPRHSSPELHKAYDEPFHSPNSWMEEEPDSVLKDKKPASAAVLALVAAFVVLGMGALYLWNETSKRPVGAADSVVTRLGDAPGATNPADGVGTDPATLGTAGTTASPPAASPSTARPVPTPATTPPPAAAPSPSSSSGGDKTGGDSAPPRTTTPAGTTSRETSSGSQPSSDKAASAATSGAAAPTKAKGGAASSIKRGWAAVEAGDLAGAERAFAQATDLSPRSGQAHYGLGYVSEKRGDKSTAAVHYCEARGYSGTDASLVRELDARLAAIGRSCG